jgi:crotonobetainyl-CoA:carnitine CoA-transferase CaiB-like acyl-CoA transferase
MVSGIGGNADGPAGRGGPLVGLDVIQLGHAVPVASCARVLADLGASVTWVSEQARPAGQGALAAAWEAFDSRGKAVAGSAPAQADVVVLDKERFLADEGQFRSRAESGQVVVVISPFGLTGPRANWLGDDLVSQAYGGGCIRNGFPDREPLRCPPGAGDRETGLGAALAALIAVFGVRHGHPGQVIDVSEVEAWTALQTGSSILEFLFLGRVEQRDGRRYLGRGYPHTILRCADGEARLICVQGREWARALEMMGRPAWGYLSRYHDRVRNQEEYADELDAIMEEWLAHVTGDELLTESLKYKIPWVPIRRLADVFREPQLQFRGYYRPERIGPWRVGYPVRFSRTPVLEPQAARNAPEPLAASRQARKAHDQPRTDSPGLLSGLRVLDLGWAWAGGLVGGILADFGADVIKVESRRRLDPMRMDRPLIGLEADIEQGSLHHNINRGKRSIMIDFTVPEGAEVIRKLAEQADVVIENMSPAVLAKYGLAYADLAKRNPRLIYLSSSAVGATGPLSGLRAYAPVLTALSGVDSMVGYDDGTISGLQHSMADPNAGIHGGVAVLAALLERDGSGRGQWLDLSQLEALIDLVAAYALAAEDGHHEFACTGNSDPRALFSGVFASHGSDQWLAVACHSRTQVKSLATVVESPSGSQDDLAEAVRAWAARQDKWEAAGVLQDAGVPAAPILDIGERFADEHLHQRGAFADVEHPVVGDEIICGVPWHMSATPGKVRHAAPLLGGQTDDVLSELLEMSSREIDVLRERGAIA